MDNIFYRFQFLHEAIIQEIKKNTGKSNICIKSVYMEDNLTTFEYYEITEWGVETGFIQLPNYNLFK